MDSRKGIGEGGAKWTGGEEWEKEGYNGQELKSISS